MKPLRVRLLGSVPTDPLQRGPVGAPIGRPKPYPRQFSEDLAESMAYAALHREVSACGYILPGRMWANVRAHHGGNFGLEVQGLTQADIEAIVELLKARYATNPPPSPSPS